MSLIFILLSLLPQDYLNLLLAGDYPAAIQYCERMAARDKGPFWKIELGDIYFDKLGNYDQAAEIYAGILKDYKQKDGSVHYRYGLALERKEDFLAAARQYEIVATQFRKDPALDSFSLKGVERCFKKNYQDLVATVDGYNFTRLELDERMTSGSPFGPKDEKAILDQMILERLLFVNGMKHQAYENEWFKREAAKIRRNLLMDEVRANLVVARAKPTDKQIKAYFKKNRDLYKLQEEIRGKEIVVESESLALFLRDSLVRDTAAFDTLVKLYSKATTAGNAGNMGIVFKGTKPKPIEDVIFSLPAHTLSPVVPHDGKFGIYYVTEHKMPRYRRLEEVRTQVEASVNAENVKDLEIKLNKDLKARALIEKYPDSIAVNETLMVASRIVARLNGLPITWEDVDRRNIDQPAFGRVDMAKPEEVMKVLDLLIEELLKITVAEQNKYFLNETFFTSFHERKRQLLEQALYTKVVIEAVTVDSAEIAQYYRDHHEDYKIFEMADCQELVVRSRKLAEDLRKQVIAEPEKFDTLIQQYTIAPTKVRYGKTGNLRRGMKSKAFENAVFKLKPGSFSNVFAFVKLLKYTPPGYRTYEEVKPWIETTIRREKQNKIAEEFLNRIKAEAKIEIFLTASATEPAPDSDVKPAEPQGDIKPRSDQKE